ncbi:hypothetical protein [Streptomyces sp. OK228]|uniref:hypothetical protein n=1 Tax=Streptomyces sp. OK228 TaxID=1882786 RepID=UPI000BDAF48E|nr:hypothetical protein [Streptomyces sp. OK228]SOE25647.1 hypothetical protein SAMN05442782_2390 [Streptomyces sp. OK228]
MPADQTPRDFATAEINETRGDLNKPRGFTADQLVAAAGARAQLAIAAALLDVADAIRESGPESAAKQPMDLMAAALRREGRQ